MAYDSAMERGLLAALSTEDVSKDLLKSLENESAALTRFRKVRMSKNQTRIPVLETLPMAYFVNGDTGLKQTTDVSWKNKYLNVEEVAVILPIPESVLDDSDYDIWGAVKPLAVDAAARVLDNAVFNGVNKPASWDKSIVQGAIDAGNTIARGTNVVASGGVAADISDVFSEVEQDGYPVTGAIANISYRGRLRNVRNADGDQLPEVSTAEAYGVPIGYPMQGLWPSGSGAAELIAGDFSQGILGVRQDFTWKLLTEATLQDNTGATIWNLAQQDMVALRMVFRVGFATANTINYQNQNEATRYPFGVLLAP